MLLRPDSKCLNHVKSGFVQLADLGGAAAHSGLRVRADPWQVTMPDVLQRQCCGIRGWKQELNGNQLVLLRDLCLNWVDVNWVEAVQKKLLALVFLLARLDTPKWDNWSASCGATGPDRFPRTVTFSCRQRQSLETSFRFVWKGMIVARLKTPFLFEVIHSRSQVFNLLRRRSLQR